MKLAIDTSIMRNLPLDLTLENVEKIGFHYVEIGLGHYQPHEATEEETTKLKESLARHNLKLAALFGTYPISYPEEEIRLNGVRQFEATIARAAELQCNLVVAEMMGDAERHEQCSQAFRKSVAELLPTLESHRTRICFEAHPGDFTERNKVAVELIGDFKSPQVGYLYCAPHSFVLGEDVSQMIEYARGVLGYVHLSDSFRPERTFFSGRYFPQVPPHQHLVPGKGDVDMPSLFRALQGIGYDGFLTVNPFSMYDNPMVAARESKEFAESMLKGTRTD